MDFDPRDFDTGDDDRIAPDREPDPVDTEHRTRDDNDAPSLGRGPGDSRPSQNAEETRARSDRTHSPTRDQEPPSRTFDAREPFSRDLNLPRGLDRELVRDRGHEYTLRGSETRTLATVGAFRVVSSRDLRDYDDGPADPRSGDLRHLREQGLIETARVPGTREHAVALTAEGRSLLDHHRDPNQSSRQTFWAGLKREREREHDLQVYRAYEHTASRLESRDANVERVVLDHELKREYQSWLHERDRDRADYDGHPDRTDEEIAEWARAHDLPYFDEEVHFPDLRVEYRDADGRMDREDIEVVTEHYRGGHAASVARSGFSCHRGSSLRIGGSRGAGAGGGHRGGLAEEMWR
jgi:hypothetical protein